MQGGRIGVSSVFGEGSTFAFFIKARHALRSPGDNGATTLTKKPLSPKPAILHPEYAAPLNRNHSSSQNPVVGSVYDPDTLHVLIVEVSQPLSRGMSLKTDLIG